MFAAFRNAGRAAIRARRSYSTAAPGAEDTNAFIASRKAVEEHAKHSADLWRKITCVGNPLLGSENWFGAAKGYYVAFPAVIVAALNAKSLASEHEAHLEHIKEENGGELPERIVYPYFNKREKDFPWGDNTLFYNPKVNIPVQ
uniref:FGENESH: predicted gene_3.229 protein n=1 Tax=Rhodotorula toruloides TaxID=5286 RepID=A0A0K3CBB0_RHOTO